MGRRRRFLVSRIPGITTIGEGDMIRHVGRIKCKKDAKKEDIDTFIREGNKLPHVNK